MAAIGAQFFCGIGLPKTGTTWLADYLRNHPSVFVPHMKELQIFNRYFRPDLYSWMNAHISKNLANTAEKLVAGRGNPERHAELTALLAEALAMPYHVDTQYMMRAYRRLFRERLSPAHAMFGEFSTTYCVLPTEGLRLLDSAFPETRYIIVLRDPATRFWSHIRHQTRLRENFNPLTRFDDMFDDPELGEMANYRAVVQKIQGVISADRIHLALFEDLFIHHDEAALKAITDFLGIPFVPADQSHIVYAGDSLPMPERFVSKAQRRFEDSYRFGEELFGGLPEGWICH